MWQTCIGGRGGNTATVAIPPPVHGVKPCGVTAVVASSTYHPRLSSPRWRQSAGRPRPVWTPTPRSCTASTYPGRGWRWNARWPPLWPRWPHLAPGCSCGLYRAAYSRRWRRSGMPRAAAPSSPLCCGSQGQRLARPMAGHWGLEEWGEVK